MPKQVRSPLSWIGGKFYSASRILAAFPQPQSYTTYVEVFGGAAHVMFKKPPYDHVEVYNDLNGDLVNFFLQCRNHPEELQSRIDSLPYSRQLHNEWHKELFSKQYASELERAVRWFYVLKSSFGGMVTNTKAGWAYAVRRGGSGHSGSCATRFFNAVEQFKAVSARFKSVQIDQQGYEKIITTYESPTTLFYCDPPYVGKEGYYEYKEVPRFTAADHQQLATLLNNTSAKVALSYYPHPVIDKLYPLQKWRRITWNTWKHVAKASVKRPKATELLLMNYPLSNAQGIAV